MAESDIFVRFGADIDPLKRGTKKASNALQAFNNKTKITSKGLAKMAAVAAVAATAIGVKLVKDSLSAIDAQAKLAKQLGTSSASLAVLGRAADMSGISMGSIEKGAKNLEVAMGEAAGGTGEALKTLERLNLTFEDLEGLSLDEKILAVNKSLEENIPASERASAAADLFGKKAGFAIAQLNPETIAEATRQVEGMGLAISDVDAAKIEAANDAMGAVGLAVEGVVSQFTIALAPVLEDIATSFQEAAIESGGFKEEALSAAEAVMRGFGYVGNSIRGVEVIVQGLNVAFLGLKAGSLSVISSISEYLDRLVTGFSTSINDLIRISNNIPGIDMSLLVVGGSQMVEGIKKSAVEANVALEESMMQLHNKMMQPLPTEVLDAYIESLGSERILESERIKNENLSEIDRLAKEKALAEEETFYNKMQQIKEAWTTSETDAVASMFGNLSSLMQSGNKKMFEIGKTAAKAQTVVSTISSAQKSYESLAGIPIVGPALGAAAAAAAVVAGGVRLNAINSTSFAGGGSTSGAAGGAGGAAATPSAPAPAPEQRRTVSVQSLDPNSLVSGSMVNSIAEQLVELQNDGFKLVV
jgi:hypothetical protein